MKSTTTSNMKHIVTVTLVLALGLAAGYAQESVKMTFSGTSENSANSNLQQPNTGMDEDNFAGTGTLGSFTLRNVRAISNNPSTPPSTCSGPNNLYFVEPAGAGIFRFEDGSLLYVNLTQGADCIDFTATAAHCTLAFQITGGTGRFKNASGTLVLTEAVVPVIADTMNNPVYFAATGGITGRVSGVGWGQGQGDGQ